MCLFFLFLMEGEGEGKGEGGAFNRMDVGWLVRNFSNSKFARLYRDPDSRYLRVLGY